MSTCHHATFDPACPVCWLVGIDPTWPATLTDLQPHDPRLDHDDDSEAQT